MNFKPLEQFMSELSQTLNPGNAIVIYKQGEKIFEHATGVSDIENNIKMTGNEHFFIYSCTKVATMVAVTQLIERGKITTFDPLSAYIPEWKNMQIKTADGSLVPAQNEITINHLVSMTAGLDYNLLSPSLKREGDMPTVDTIRKLANEPLCFEPGTHWQYSLCHDVIAAVVEVVSGMKFRDYMKQNVFAPLGMHDTYFHPTQQVLNNMATQYCFVPESGAALDLVEAQRQGNAHKGSMQVQPKENRFELGAEYDSGGAGIVTTPQDYAKLAAALGNYGVLNGTRILTKNGIDLMRANRLSPELLKDFNWKQYQGYGYGMGVRTMMEYGKSSSISSIGEFGWCGAAGSAMIADPATGLGVFFAQHTLNPREEYFFSRLRNVIYTCLE